MAGKKLNHKHAAAPESEIVVGSGDQNHPVIGRKSFWYPKQLLYGVIGLVIIIAVVAGVWAGVNNAHMRKADRERAQLVAQAVPILTDSDTAQLKPLVDEILQEPGYKTDPDSMYVVTNYYLFIDDVKSAQAAYPLLATAYNTKHGYSNSTLKEGGYSLQDMKRKVDFFALQQKEAAKNADILTSGEGKR